MDDNDRQLQPIESILRKVATQDMEGVLLMTLGECLNMLHKDMILIDMHRPGYPSYTVKKWKTILPLDEDGYELRTRSFNFGRTQKRSIVKIDGTGLWNES